MRPTPRRRDGLRRSLVRPFLVLSLGLLGMPAARAQGGYTTEKHPALGIEFKRARHYEQVPTQPGEQWVVLQYVEKREASERYERKQRPQMWILEIPWAPDPEPPPEAPAEERRTTTEPVKAPPPPITTFERWVEQRLRGWSVVRAEVRAEQEEWTGSEYELVRASKDGAPPRGGKTSAWAFAWRSPERTIAVLGECGADDFDGQVNIWRKAAERMELAAPRDDSAERAKLVRYYERRPKYVDPEFRVDVRLALVDGWDFRDTENYIVVFSTPDQPLVRQICRELEQLREAYIELFPPSKPLTAVSTVRVCKSRAEYLLYGGAPSSAGYWNSRAEELVLYDARVKEKGRATSDTDTFIVLYHEAFHQYIHYSTGELPPHSWFNEGHGDYFSGALISGGKLRKIDQNTWRTNTIKRAVERGEHARWQDIIRWEQAEYYKNGGRNYAQGWSMVYFLRSKPASRREDWARILPVYFDTLKAAYPEELATAEDPTDPKLRQECGARARERAVTAAFESVDLDELERAWIDFVIDLPSVERER